MTTTQIPTAELDALVEALGAEKFGCEAGCHMTCSEADALALILYRVDPVAAAAFLAGHATADAKGAQHPWDVIESSAAADYYLAELARTSEAHTVALPGPTGPVVIASVTHTTLTY